MIVEKSGISIGHKVCKHTKKYQIYPENWTEVSYFIWDQQKNHFSGYLASSLTSPSENEPNKTVYIYLKKCDKRRHFIGERKKNS